MLRTKQTITGSNLVTRMLDKLFGEDVYNVAMAHAAPAPTARSSSGAEFCPKLRDEFISRRRRQKRHTAASGGAPLRTSWY